MSAVAVRLGSAEYGLPMARVHEVLRPPPVTRIPFPPEDIRGVTQVRGVVLAVLDLGTRLRGRPAAEPGRLVVVTHGAERIGLLVDQVTGVVEEMEEVEPSEPPEEALAALEPGWLAGVAEPDPGRRVALLHLDEILAERTP